MTERATAENRLQGEAVKPIRRPLLGPLTLEFSAFLVDGRIDLAMLVYDPPPPEDAERIRSLGEDGDAPAPKAMPQSSPIPARPR